MSEQDAAGSISHLFNPASSTKALLSACAHSCDIQAKDRLLKSLLPPVNAYLFIGSYLLAFHLKGGPLRGFLIGRRSDLHRPFACLAALLAASA